MSEPSLNIWEKALGWRKRQMIIKQLDPISTKIRNNAIEEVAKEIEKMSLLLKLQKLRCLSKELF